MGLLFVTMLPIVLLGILVIVARYYENIQCIEKYVSISTGLYRPNCQNILKLSIFHLIYRALEVTEATGGPWRPDFSAERILFWQERLFCFQKRAATCSVAFFVTQTISSLKVHHRKP